jgi:hypothetical protein
MTDRIARRQWTYFATASALLFGGLVTAANAATHIDDFESSAVRNDFRQLDASELGELHGRYVEGNQVLLFGMEMSTVWQSPTGEVFEARADLQVDLSGASPAVSFTPHITATSDEAYQELAASSDRQVSVIDSGTGNVSGVVQVVQSGGDFNVAGNDFQLDINYGSRRQAQTGNGETSLASESGAQVSIQGGANGLGMSIAMPGQGEAAQGIRSGRGLHQSVQLTGSHQEVHNMTRMQVQMDQDIGGNVPTGDLRRALESTRNLERSF